MLPIYSLTKTFIAASVVATGIDLQARVSDWIVATLLPRGRDISVEQLLNHTSGIRDYFEPPSPYPNAVAEQLAVWDDATFAKHTLQQPLWFEPGTRFAYSNPNYWLLGQILQRATGLSLADVLAEQICRPLGLTSVVLAEGQFAAELPNYPAGWVWHGLLLASADDVARFMASPLVTPLRANPTPVELPNEHPNWRDPRYGYGLMEEAKGQLLRFGHNGEGPGFSASCYHFPASGRTICALLRGPAAESDAEGAAVSAAEELEEAAMRRVLQIAVDIGG